MFYLLLRMLHEDLKDGKISQRDYIDAVVKIADFHGIQRNGII